MTRDEAVAQAFAGRHLHSPKSKSVTEGGTVYEVCECGATRVYQNISTAEHILAQPWHTCELCTHPYGRGV